MSYNGWPNRETWLVVIWYNPETKQDVLASKDMLEKVFDNTPNGIFRDLSSFYEIDWEYLINAFDDEEPKND